MDFPKKQQQSLIPRYLLQYLQDLQISHNDPTAPWGGGGGGGSYTAGDGIDITNDVISVDDTVALKTDLLDYVTTSELTTELGNYVTSTDLATELLDYAELDDIPTKTSDLTNDSGFITSSALTNYVTTNTSQEITGAKVFKGSYKITCQSTANEGASVAFKASSQSSSQYPIGVMEIDERLKVMKFSVNGVVGPDYVPALGYFGGSSDYDYVAKLPKGRDKYNSIRSGDVYLPLSINKTKADSSGNISLNIPTNTSDLTNDSGYITSSALTGYATETWVTNQGYSTFSGSYNDLTDTPSLATVATSGSYNDLTNKPTIPTISGNYSGSYWTSISINGISKGIPSGGSAPTNMVTTNTDQNITGTKTFVGKQKIRFRQQASSETLGFTAYDNNNNEIGNLQVANRAIGGSTYPYVTLGNFSTQNEKAKVGFRIQPNNSQYSYNFVMPYGTYSNFESNTYSTDADTTIPCAFTDGTTIVKADATGLVNISSISGGGGGGTTVSGTNDGTNWTSITIGSDTYGIPSGGGGGGSSLAPQIYNFTSEDWSASTNTNGYISNTAMSREGLNLSNITAGQTIKIDVIFKRPSNGQYYVHQFTLVMPDGTNATQTTDTFQIPNLTGNSGQIENWMDLSQGHIGIFWSNSSMERYISKVKVYPANA